MVKIFLVPKIMTDVEMINHEGDHFDESHYRLILNENADVYE